MRDAKRIDATLDLLREYWMQHPDMRLGQIIVNLCQPEEPCPDLFYTEDEILMARLKVAIDD